MLSKKKLNGINNNIRYKEIDILKGIGIILMVVGHCNNIFVKFIYLFHMAIFFMSSGFFWNDKNVQDLKACKNYVIRKIKTLWLPFFICNSIFTIFNNLFIHIGFYTNNKLFLKLPIGEYDHLTPILNLKSTFINLTKNCFFTGNTQLGGATWFLKTLFVVSITHMIIRYIRCHLKNGKFISIISLLLACIGAQIISKYQIRLPLGGSTLFAGYIAFNMGVFIRKFKFVNYIACHQKTCLIISCFILIVLNHFGKIEINHGIITNLIFFITVSLSGWTFIYSLASLTNKHLIGNFLAYIGKHTIWIVTLHFLCFKIVTLIYIKIKHLSILYLAMFPTINNKSNLWIIYSMVGVCMPIIIEYLKRKLTAIFFKSKNTCQRL